MKLLNEKDKECNSNKSNKKDDISEEEIYNDLLETNKELKDNKDSIKKLLIEQIFYQKYASSNYEIPTILFNEIEIEPYGNCLYCCISFYL